MMSITSVILTVFPARAVSNTSLGKGEVLDYLMVTGVQVGKKFTAFSHRNYRKHVPRTATPKTMRIDMPLDMAERLLVFVQRCFVPRSTHYDSRDFTEFLCGRQTRPTSRPGSKVLMAVRPERNVLPMKTMVICDGDGNPLHPCLGLRNRTVMAVNGTKGELAVCNIWNLQRVYGGSKLAVVR